MKNNNQLSGFRFWLSGGASSDPQGSSRFWREKRTPNVKAVPAFTLIETFVAITVLLMALVGPMSIAAQSLRIAYYARDQVTAFYLAQEGVEYVRAMRDQNYLANTPWLTGIADCENASCVIDFPNFTHAVCPVGTTCPPVYVSSDTTLYNENAASGPASPFTRVLTITPISGTNDEVELTVTVSWASAGISRQFRIIENLFNWSGS